MEQRMKSTLTKQKILNAAEYEFSENGFSATRVDVIAQKAEVNKQLIYAHFKSKEHLYTKVLERVYKRLEKCEEKLSEREFEGPETIRRTVLDYFDFLIDNPTFVRLMLWENLNYAKNLDGVDIKIFQGVTKILESGKKKKLLRPDLDIRQTVISINMFCFSAFSNIYTVSKLLGKDLYNKEELKKRAEQIADVLTQYVIGPMPSE